MEEKGGRYARFEIRNVKDLLELKELIQKWPISSKEKDTLYEKLKKGGNKHLVVLFEIYIMGKRSSSKSRITTTKPTLKPVPKPVPQKKKIKTQRETYQQITCKASDFKFKNGEIRMGIYVCETKRSFCIHSSILKNIQGEFTIQIRPGQTFYFENHGLTKLLGLVEEYCHSILDEKCEEWFQNKIDTIKTNVIRSFDLRFSDFIFNEENKRYEIKDNAIKYSPLDRNFLLLDFSCYVDRLKTIPPIYRTSYLGKQNLAKLIDKFTKEFRNCLADILRKDVYYTSKDIEAIEWSYTGSYKPSIHVWFNLVDEYEGVCETIITPSFVYVQDVVFRFHNLPKGTPFEFGDETIKDIESSVEQVVGCGMDDLLSVSIQSIKQRKKIDIVKNVRPSGGYSIINCLDGSTMYHLKSAGCLLDISDEHYLKAHPRVEDYTYILQTGRINKIAYFRDPNWVLSQESPDCGVECYLLANDQYIVLYALDRTKSTYVFKVKKGCVDKAMFLIWTYFSSCIYNKREGKSIDIRYLFSYFGIEWYDNMGSPISKNEDGIYQFNLPLYFY